MLVCMVDSRVGEGERDGIGKDMMAWDRIGWHGEGSEDGWVGKAY